jgi:hypothetical protein
MLWKLIHKGINTLTGRHIILKAGRKWEDLTDS